ncbi:hypothetical protein D3C87_1626150 [compost metagenome]
MTMGTAACKQEILAAVAEMATQMQFNHKIQECLLLLEHKLQAQASSLQQQERQLLVQVRTVQKV